MSVRRFAFVVALVLAWSLGASTLEAHDPAHPPGAVKGRILLPAATPPPGRVPVPAREGAWTTLAPLLPINPRQLSLLPNGKVLLLSGPAAASSFAAIWDPEAKRFAFIGRAEDNALARAWGPPAISTALQQAWQAREVPGSTAVLLPLRPENNYAAHLMILGGGNPATRACAILDLAKAAPARSTAPMSLPRTCLNAVLLPNGKLLALGGSFLERDASTASLGAELFDPRSETWSPAGFTSYPHLNHAGALLLPDATVFVAGGNPHEAWEEHLEIYSPPFLFRDDGTSAERPLLTDAPNDIACGARFAAKTPDASTIRDVVLLRAGSPADSLDLTQRLVELAWKADDPGEIEALAPPNETVAPPGNYLLFLLDKKGVPSLGRFVRLAARHAP